MCVQDFIYVYCLALWKMGFPVLILVLLMVGAIDEWRSRRVGKLAPEVPMIRSFDLLLEDERERELRQLEEFVKMVRRG